MDNKKRSSFCSLFSDSQRVLQNLSNFFFLFPFYFLERIRNKRKELLVTEWKESGSMEKKTILTENFTILHHQSIPEFICSPETSIEKFWNSEIAKCLAGLSAAAYINLETNETLTFFGLGKVLGRKKKWKFGKLIQLAATPPDLGATKTLPDEPFYNFGASTSVAWNCPISW